MKKIILGFLSIFFVGQIAMAQPVSDNAVIPMAITVNSILRLNVVDGGNIEFVFNTLNDYSAGLSGTQYATTFTVASSRNWNLSILATTGTFLNDAGVGISLEHVCFIISETGAFSYGVDNTFNTTYRLDGGVAAALTDRSDLAFVAADGLVLVPGTGNAGTVLDNIFTINWECGTAACTAGSLTGTASGRYSTSILLSLSAL